jgi:catechol 2,3-dioxygenase-like lactoylglutathione lyase family enzyme
LVAPKRKSADDWRMKKRVGLSRCKLAAFVNVVDVDRARAFYRDTLGLRLVSEELPFAMVFDANGTMLRLAIGRDASPGPGTVLGWQVLDITVAVRDLLGVGVRFERYEFMKQDELGIWTTPTGARVAWFKDPDGNVLSISEHPAG